MRKSRKYGIELKKKNETKSSHIESFMRYTDLRTNIIARKRLITEGENRERNRDRELSTRLRIKEKPRP